MTSTNSQTSGNVSVVLNYSAHEILSDYADRDGFVQLTRSAGRVFIVVDGKPVGSVSAEEFTTATAKLAAPTTGEIERNARALWAEGRGISAMTVLAEAGYDRDARRAFLLSVGMDEADAGRYASPEYVAGDGDEISFIG